MASRTKNGLLLKWNAPVDNGSPITLYSVEWDQVCVHACVRACVCAYMPLCIQCGSEYVEVFSGKAKQFKFNHKFQPGAVAHFRLRALNEIGWR